MELINITIDGETKVPVIQTHLKVVISCEWLMLKKEKFKKDIVQPLMMRA
jgi:hypothetical protein